MNGGTIYRGEFHAQSFSNSLGIAVSDVIRLA